MRRDKDHACPVCGGSVYKIRERLVCAVCSWGWPWYAAKSRKRKPEDKKAA